MIPPPIGRSPKPKTTKAKIDRGSNPAQRRRVYCPACDTIASVIAENVDAPCRVCKGPVEARHRGRPRKASDSP